MYTCTCKVSDLYNVSDSFVPFREPAPPGSPRAPRGKGFRFTVVVSKGLSLFQWIVIGQFRWTFSGIFQWNFTFVISGTSNLSRIII